GAPPLPPPLGRPADPQAVGKNLRRRVRRPRAADPARAVEVWAEDEARPGLKPVTRRVWWLKGCRPRSGGRTRYEWLYAYGSAGPFRALVREAVANDTFGRLADLRRRVARRRCRRLAGDPPTVKGAIGFRWAVDLEA